MEGRNHILFISSWYPNRNNPTHGIFNQAFAKAASLYHKVSVLHVCSDGNLSAATEAVTASEDGIVTVTMYYKKVRTGLPLFSQLQKRARLLAAFEEGYRLLTAEAGTPDLIQLNVVMPAGIGALHLSQKYDLPYVINEGWSGYCPEDGNYKGFFLRHFTKKIIAGAERIMPVSEHLKKAMLAHGLHGQYSIVPNVVNTVLFAPFSPPSPPSSTIRFIHISTLDDIQKNVSGILRAFAKALQQDAGLELNIVGDGPGRPELEELARQLAVAHRVRFKGRLLGTALAEELNNNDALVMFSNYETFCLTVAEALACGKPVITSRAGGLTDHIGPDLGLAIHKKDEAGLSAAFLQFKAARPGFAPEHLRQFITSRFTAEQIGKQLAGIYESVIRSKNNQPC